MTERYPGPALLLFFCLLSPAISFARQAPPPQSKPAPPPTTPAQNFAAEPFILQSAAFVVDMKADGTGTELQTNSIKIQSEAGLRNFSVLSIPFSSLNQRVDFLYVRAVHPDGTTQETPVSSAMEQSAPVTQQAPFYSDLKTKQIPVRSLHVGDTLQWQTRSTQTTAEAPGHFWGQAVFYTGAVVLDETHELRVPSSLKLTVWTNPRDGAPAVESTEGEQRVYRWHHADLNPTAGAAAEAAKHAEETRLRTPEEDLDATKGKLPSIAWTTFADWAAVGAWYRDLSVPRALPDDAIKSKVAELTKGATTDLARAQAIYNFVSMQIRYIGVSFGIGRYQPHLASEVLANQYGDCKDKHTLLAAMFAAAGLHADPVLIGAGIRFNSAVPSPSSFNHLITRLQLDGQTVWLDSTTEVAPWRVLLANIRDQEALVIPSSAPATVVRTPTDLPYPAVAESHLVGAIDKSLASDSRMTLTFHDDDEIILRSVLRNTSPSEYGTFTQNFMAGMGFGGKTSDPAIDNLEDTTHPFALSFTYHRVKEDAWGENRVTAAFTPITLPAFDPKTPPVYTIQFGAPRMETSTVELTLPAGWNVELPEAVHAHSSFATCDVTFHRSGDKIIGERRLVVLKSKLPASDYKQYQAWYDTAGAGSVPYIQLIPPISVGSVSVFPKPELPASTSASAAATAPSDPKAADLVQQAGTRIRSMDPDGSRKLLDQAKVINPTERGLWTGYGAVASMLGASTEATNDLKQEITFHPDEIRLYDYIAQEQTTHGDREGAITTIRQWVKAQPASPEAAVDLVNRLAAASHDADAVTEGKASIARLASGSEDLTALRIAVARAQSTLGQHKEAAASVEPLLATVTDPDQVNLITYTLAEANTSLPAAAAAELKAIAAVESETTGWTLTETPYVIITRQNLLAAMWDTMAWILHQQAKDNEALTYIEAAARALDRSDVHDHFVAIAAALHTPALTARAAQSSQQLRTYPLGPSKGRHGTPEFRFLIVAGKVETIGPPGGNPLAAPTAEPSASSSFPGAEDLLRSADLHALLPTGSAAHIVRAGFVNCHSATCELILTPFTYR